MSTSNAVAKRPSANRPPITYAEWFTVANGCVPLAMMMIDARYHQLGSDPIRSAMHITGSLALSFLILSIAVTPVRKLTRWNWLHAYRRPLGLMSFLYATSHLAIFIGFDRDWELSDAWSEILQRRYLQFGGIALLAMVPLAITSTPRMVRLLTIRRWKLLHRLVYVSAIAAVIHYWMQSKADLAWQFTAIMVLSLLLLFRVVAAIVCRQ